MNEPLWQWVRKQALFQQDGKCTGFILEHYSLSEQRTLLDRFELGPKTDPGSLAGEIETAAQRHADAFAGTPQRYVLSAVFGDKGRPHYAFRLSAEEPSPSARVSEPPNTEGVLAQQMRHSEIMLQAMIDLVGKADAHDLQRSKATERAIGMLVGQTDRLLGELQNHRARSAELEQQAVEITHHRQQHELAVLAELRKNEREQATIKTLKDLGSVAMARFARGGGPFLPQQRPAQQSDPTSPPSPPEPNTHLSPEQEEKLVVAQVAQFMDGLDPRHIAAIFQSLPGTKQMLLHEIITTVQAVAQRQATAPESPNRREHDMTEYVHLANAATLTWFSKHERVFVAFVSYSPKEPPPALVRVVNVPVVTINPEVFLLGDRTIVQSGDVLVYADGLLAERFPIEKTDRGHGLDPELGPRVASTVAKLLTQPNVFSASGVLSGTTQSHKRVSENR